MTGQSQLEQRYRRLLAFYPREFRQAHGEEMLAVLMSGAGDASRPAAADAVNLIANALLMRLRPGAPKSTPTVFWAVRLMVIGACLEFVALGTVVATQGDTSATLIRHFPALTVAQANTLAHQSVPALVIGAPITALVWLWLAWANGRGHGWARAGLALLFALTTVSMLSAIGQHAATYALVDLIAGAAVWLVALAALVLVLGPWSEDHYRRAAHRDEHQPTPMGASRA